VVEIYDRARPKLLTYFLARDQLARPLKQHCEQLEGLLLQRDTPALFGEFAAAQIRFEEAEFHASRRCGGLVH
jgi:hypothetical protein